MRQLTLDIRPEENTGFDGFVAGDNAEALEHLRELASPQCFNSIYLWGESGSGRSHLLSASASTARLAGRGVVHLSGAEIGSDISMPAGGLLIVDEVDRLGPAAQIALFRAYNTARLIGMAMLVAGDLPPLQLTLREDLRTRIGQALIYQIHPLSDEDKAETLLRHARSRGLSISVDLITYLLRHGRRDLGSLMATLDALDEISLVQKRAPSLPMLKEILLQWEGGRSGEQG